MGWTVRVSNLAGGDNGRTRPDRPQDLPSPLYNGYRDSLPGGNWPELGVVHPPPTTGEFEYGYSHKFTYPQCLPDM